SFPDEIGLRKFGRSKARPRTPPRNRKPPLFHHSLRAPQTYERSKNSRFQSALRATANARKSSKNSIPYAEALLFLEAHEFSPAKFPGPSNAELRRSTDTAPASPGKYREKACRDEAPRQAAPEARVHPKRESALRNAQRRAKQSLSRPPIHLRCSPALALLPVSAVPALRREHFPHRNQ